MTLKDLNIGETAVVGTVGGEGALRQHFLDMGLIPGEKVTLVKFAPMGDPMELSIHGYELTLRLDDAARIGVTLAKAPAAKKAEAESEKPVEHPGLGEGGRYHTKKGENPLPDGPTLTFALAGNQNCGKTTLFNQLTGSNQHVGNFPGVTVDRKSGAIRNNPNTEVTDLPGIYSMSPYTSEEIVTRQFIIGEKPTGIINIVDATNIERNLYLTMQLMELDTPMVLALNMMDEMRGNGGTVRINKMEAMLGIPVIPISAAKNEGVDELVDHAVHVAKYQERPGRMDFCSEDDHGGAVHRCIHGILHLNEDNAKAAGIPVRYWSTLQSGQPVGGFLPSQVLGPPRRGLKVVYATDTRPCAALRRAAQDADLLLMDSTYADDADLPKAKLYGHSTCGDTGVLAAEANVCRLWLTHYSAAVTDLAPGFAAAQQAFPTAAAGVDGMRLTLNFDPD